MESRRKRLSMSSSDYVERAAALVVDANIAIGFILGGRTRGTQIVFGRLVAAAIPLLAPEEMLGEVERHLTEIVSHLLARRHATGDEFRRGQQEAEDRWREMQAALHIVPAVEYQHFETTAR